MSKKNFYLASKESFQSRVIPVLWASAKTYYEQYGKFASEWTWSDPWLTHDFTNEQILEICKKSPPNIFAFSCYVWNEEYMDNLARQIKQEFPSCLIVYGGPQVNIKYNDNFFQVKPWVDIVCPSDGYGEILLASILDNYPVTNYEDIPYIYYTNQYKEKKLSTKSIEKKTFSWPNNIFKSQEKYLIDKIDEVQYVLIETTRGCPYKCIYCDWGGGTYTKVVPKPYTTILDEIEWAAKHNIKTIEIGSANFGILPIDIDISEYVVEMNKKYGYPKNVYSENAKNSLSRVAKIKSLWAKASLLNHYKVSVQTLNEEIKQNIERIDPDIEDQIKVIKELKSKVNNLPIKVETIIGLPGDSYLNNMAQIDIMFKHELPMPRPNIWMLLPEAPAYSPEMRERFKIKTIQKMFITHPWSIKEGYKVDEGMNTSNFPQNKNVESVVGTYSYSSKEFVDMFLLNSIAQAGDSTGLNKYFIRYITDTSDLNSSTIIDILYKNFFQTKRNWEDKILAAKFYSIYETINNWVHKDSLETGFDYHKNFPLVLPIYTYIPFLIFSNIQLFYNLISDYFCKLLKDDKILDLGHFLGNAFIDINYNPKDKRKFKTKYNWLEYFKTGTLNLGNYEYFISDDVVYTNGNYLDIDWHTISPNVFEQKKQFVYKQLGDITLDKISQTIRLI